MAVVKRNSRKLITLRTLDHAIQHQDVSVRLRLEDKDVLEERFLDVQDFLDLEGHCLARPLGRDLAEPAICGDASARGQVERERAYRGWKDGLGWAWWSSREENGLAKFYGKID